MTAYVRNWVVRLLWTMAAMMVALTVSAGVALGQMELGSIQGTVKDDSGQPLEGVSFKLKDQRGREIEVKTDKSGRFFRRGLPPLDYEIAVEKPGYQPIYDKLKLSAGLEKRYDFKLGKTTPEGSADFAKALDAFTKGDYQAAASGFEEVVRKAPDAPEVRVNLAMAYMRLSRTDDAVAQIEKAVSLAPNRPVLLFQLGAVYVEAKKYDRAIDVFERGLGGQPDLTDPLAYEATVTLGAVYFATGKIDQAVARFEKALGARPSAAQPTLGLGKCAFSRGEVDKALGYFRQVVSSSPGTPEAAEAEAFVKELEKSKS